MDLKYLMSFNGPNEVQKPGSIKRHEFFVYSCLSVDPKTSCLLMDPGKHQGSIKRHEVLGPSKDMRFHEGKHKNGSIKAHEVFGPSNEILYQI